MAEYIAAKENIFTHQGPEGKAVFNYDNAITREFSESAPGQVVLDVGINVGPEGGLQGDVDFQGAIRTAGAVTPVPGGVGAVTTAVLAKHVVEAAERTLSCGP